MAVLGSATAFAGQAPVDRGEQGRPTADGPGVTSVIYKGRSSFSGQHGSTGDHLPAARENIEVVSKFTPTSQGPIVPGQIADVAVHKTTAYLTSWNRGTNCNKGGFYSVDISNPAEPKELAFVAARPGTYHGEGAHATTLTTGGVTRDVLAVNNESCVAAGTGGFELYDVTNPAAPVRLTTVEGGDRSPTSGTTPRAKPTASHSVFIWQAGDKAYAVTVDNGESARTDTDIFDITDPTAPVQIGDYDLDALFPEVVGNAALGNQRNLHDMVVERIGDRYILLASYWDAGYIQVDVTDPRNPTLVGDTDFGTTDPLTGKTPPEGNAHQAEFSYDNRYLVAADEDFSPFRFKEFRMTTGPNAGAYPAGEFGWTKPIATLEDKTLNGPTVYGGYGCDASAAQGRGIPSRASSGLTLDPGEEAIVVLQRGPVDDPTETQPDGPDAGSEPDAIPACTFQEKAENAAEAGYDAVLIANHHSGSGNGASPDAAICGSGTGADIIGVCIGHRLLHLLFGETPKYGPYTPGDSDEPTRGALGEKVFGQSEFDGWGYAHVYDRASGRELGAYAIEEALDERFAFGFGDLSIHEWATDPTEFVAYSSYYAGGIRVAQFGDFGLRETGKFIDRGGSNFWGIEQFNSPDNRERLLAASDRDYGLYILRYTGSGAAAAPSCEDALVYTPSDRSVVVPLRCSDPNTHNVLTRSIVTAPANGTVVVQGDRATYTPKSGFRGADRFTFRASDGSLVSRPAEARVLVGRCSNQINGTDGGDLIDGTALPDSVDARGGDDTVAAAQGADCVDGGAGDDSVTGAQGADVIIGGLGRDRLFGDASNDTIDGGDDVDHIRGGSGHDRLTGRSGNDYLDGGSNNDRVSGGSGRDSIIGGAGRDRLSGGSGDDSIDAGKSRNRVRAGSGDDRINTVNGSRDRVNCGRGFDKVEADRGDRVARNCERVARSTRSR